MCQSPTVGRSCAPSSARRSGLGRRKTPDRFALRVECLEHRQQLGDRQKVRNAFREVQQLQASALTADGGIGAYDLAETRAVDVRDPREVEKNVPVILVEETVDLVPQELVAVAERNLALHVE